MYHSDSHASEATLVGRCPFWSKLLLVEERSETRTPSQSTLHGSEFECTADRHISLDGHSPSQAQTMDVPDIDETKCLRFLSKIILGTSPCSRVGKKN